MEFQLYCTSTEQKALAKVVKLSGRHVDDFQNCWCPYFSESDEQDSHWDWSKKIIDSRGKPNYEFYALECDDPATQGLMMIDLDLHRSKLEENRNLVYVEFIHTAPWNRRSLVNSVAYKGVGSALLSFAVMRSVKMEYKGRVGLHCLSRSEEFYTKFGMTLLNDLSQPKSLKYFELSREKAKNIINILQKI